MRTRDGTWNPLVPYLGIIRCPACGVCALAPEADAVLCGACGARHVHLQTVLDLAPDHAGRREAAWTPAAPYDRWEGEVLPGRWEALGPVDREVLVAFATAAFRPGASGPVVDLQGGLGWMARQLARWVGVARVLVVDEDVAGLRAVQAMPRDPGMAYLRADPRSLPFADGSVSGIVAFGDPTGVVADPAALAEIARVLAPDGTVIGLARARADGSAAVWGALRATLGLDAPPDAEALRTRVVDAGLAPRVWSRMGEAVLWAAGRAPSA